MLGFIPMNKDHAKEFGLQPQLMIPFGSFVTSRVSSFGLPTVWLATRFPYEVGLLWFESPCLLASSSFRSPRII